VPNTAGIGFTAPGSLGGPVTKGLNLYSIQNLKSKIASFHILQSNIPKSLNSSIPKSPNP